MKIATDVMGVLDRAVVEGNSLRLTEQLDPALYKRVNKVLDAAGGKWNRKAQAHLFERDVATTIDQIILTGEILIPQDFGFFPTPPAVVGRLLELAQLAPGMTMLEPEAGTGNIGRPAAEICTVDCVELLEANVKVLREAGFARSVVHGDFLKQAPARVYDRVVMNPPFEKQADIVHVNHALNFVVPGGRLTAVMGAGVSFRSNKLTESFRDLVNARGGRLEALGMGAFKASGTMVNTLIATIPG
ncbi:methyltransferase (plasmid) [Cupriavidus pinatubonensis]|uniref:methyltransferase n=1 Tax=Cupriavidus pinatubonensis TaxID=248026 RepID=UPI001C736493|nr:methyltransferase [Cupriavidus pinatubonensis]QYY33590.1 methyltransferase [Cupriavidus pinatubonensis]